jgi:hypothetical protein
MSWWGVVQRRIPGTSNQVNWPVSFRQFNCLMVMLTCFRFLAICCLHVNLLSIVILRYLISVFRGIWISLMVTSGVELFRRVKVIEQDLFSFILIRHYIFNGIIRTSYWPKQFKISQIITIVKPGKDPTEVASYRPISLLSVLSKVFEKLILRRINKDFRPDEWIPHHQFGFRQGHSTIHQILRFKKK